VRPPRTAALTTDQPGPVPPCAAPCPLVTTLLAEIARLRGTTEAVQRVAHGIDDVPSGPRDPVQGKRPDRV